MAFKVNDFVELDYTGHVKDSKDVFDTTDAGIARAHHLQGSAPGKVVIPLGKGFLHKGLELKLVGKDVGKHRIELNVDEAFGKKSAKLLKLIPTQEFVRDNIQPQPGLPVQVDGAMGFVKTVNGGRTIVDFNHPVAGKEVYYDVDAHRVITDVKEKVSAVVKLLLKVNAQITVTKDDATITFKQELPDDIREGLITEIKESTGVKHVTVLKA
ncbi:MAG: FKBP-type peptidyl-prolyl cis-trans isomerase [Nanoarchaeota archaeon]